jgi:cephalosporin hydroxylase
MGSSSALHSLKHAAYGLPLVRDLVERHRAVVRERDALRKEVLRYEAMTRTPGVEGPPRIGGFRPKARPAPLTEAERKVVDDFHRLYYARWEAGEDTISIGWFGHRTLKCPLDLWTYQELIAERAPDLIIETGTRFGGSAYYLASICQLLGHGRVVSVDIDQSIRRPQHPRITYLAGSSTAPEVVARVKAEAAGAARIFVILDSDHRRAHVEAELEAYADLVGPDDYLIVEDTNVNGHPAYPAFGEGPMEAVEAFLQKRRDFAPDPRCERFLLTLNPHGFLRRASAG